MRKRWGDSKTMTTAEQVGPVLAKARDDGLINFRVRYEDGSMYLPNHYPQSIWGVG